MVEYIEIFRAQIELDAFRETKLMAQCEIGMVVRVRAAQPVPGKISRLLKGW